MRWLKTETVSVKLLVPSGLTVAGLIGGFVGYALASKTLEKKFREIADSEIQEAKIFYQEMYSRPTLIAEDVQGDDDELEGSTGPHISPAQLFEELEPEDQHRIMTNAMQALGQYKAAPDEVPASGPTTVNIFTQATPPGEEVLAALLADRDPSAPYIITKAEFYENEPDNEQMLFTYYEGDGVLVDDKDEYNPVDNEKVAGEDNLLRFGYGSGDVHTLYIRNETVDPPMDLCISRSVGKYMIEVLGGDLDETEPHLKHSNSQMRRFRHSDE